MGFFKRVKTAVLNFEGYKGLADENVTKAMKYFFQIILIFVIFATISTAYPVINTIQHGVQYIKTDMPNFVIKDDKLTIESEEPVKTVNDNMSLLIFLNPNISSEDVNDFFEENKSYDNVALFTENRLLLKVASTSGIMSYDYKTLTQTLNVNEMSKQAIVDYFDNSGYVQLFTAIFLIMFAYLLLTYIIVTMVDVLILSLLALITSKLYKAGLDYKKCFNISVYALTLPILLNIIYVLINSFTGFTIQYFQIMYYVIAYIYVIASILIIKTDFNKTGSDVIKIVEEIKKQEEEELPIEEPKEEKKEKKKEEDKKDDTTPEPDPGNA